MSKVEVVEVSSVTERSQSINFHLSNRKGHKEFFLKISMKK